MVSKSQTKRPVVAVCLNEWSIHAEQVGVADFAREAGWILQLVPPEGREPFPIHRPRPDGLVTNCPDHLPSELTFEGLPTVALRPGKAQATGHCIIHDYDAVGRMGAEHLLERQYTNFAFYSRDDSIPSRMRFEGFRDRLAEADRSVTRIVSRGKPEPLRDALRDLPLPLGVMAENDRYALEVLNTCLTMGLDVPGEIAVLGVDDELLVGDLAPVPLSSIDDNHHRRGYEAAQLLQRLLSDEPVPEPVICIPPSHVVTRRSTDVVAVAHTGVSKAISFIRAHFKEPSLTMNDIANEVPMSRRGFYNAFAREMGQTPWTYLTRCRVHHAEQLLLEGELRLNEIAPLCGFSSPEHFYQAFRRITGMSPRQWRKEHG